MGNGRLKVRHLTSVHPVDDSRILRRECRSLHLAGYDITLIAAQPPTGPVAEVPVIGVGAAGSRLDRAARAAWRVYRAARRERADIYQLHDPELLWVGMLLKLHGHCVVYDVHEDVPKQILQKFWLPRWARRPLAGVARLSEHLAAMAFDGVVVANPATARRFPAGKTVVVQNFPELAVATDLGADIPFERRRFAFAYTGGLSEAQGAREVIATSAVLGRRVLGVLAGAFDDARLEAQLRAAPGWSSVCYLGRLAQPGVLASVRNARVGLALNRKVSNYFDAYSTKMFEYMACGVPVVCSDFPHWIEILDGADCGIAVDPSDPHAVAAAVNKMLVDPAEARRMGDNGRRAIVERYHWEREFAKLDALYRRIAC